MRATYVDFTCDILKKETVGTPVYTNRVAQQLGTPISLMVKKPLQLLLLRSSELWMALSFLN